MFHLVRSTPALVLSLLLMITALGGTATAETREYVYDTSFGAGGDGVPSTTIVWDVCYDINTVGEAIGDDNLDEEVCGLNGGHIQIGGVQNMDTPEVYTSAVIASSDATFSRTYKVGAYSHEVGGFAEPSFDSGCGPLVSLEREASYLNVFVYGLYLTDDLEVCGGSTGSLFVNYF